MHFKRKGHKPRYSGRGAYRSTDGRNLIFQNRHQRMLNEEPFTEHWFYSNAADSPDFDNADYDLAERIPSKYYPGVYKTNPKTWDAWNPRNHHAVETKFSKQTKPFLQSSNNLSVPLDQFSENQVHQIMNWQYHNIPLELVFIDRDQHGNYRLNRFYDNPAQLDKGHIQDFRWQKSIRAGRTRHGLGNYINNSQGMPLYHGSQYQHIHRPPDTTRLI